MGKIVLILYFVFVLLTTSGVYITYLPEDIGIVDVIGSPLVQDSVKSLVALVGSLLYIVELFISLSIGGIVYATDRSNILVLVVMGATTILSALAIFANLNDAVNTVHNLGNSMLIGR